MDLLVSYSWGQFSRARREIGQILEGFGDPNPIIEKSAVMGISVVQTRLDNRDVIRKCRELYQAEPLTAFEFAIKWVPVDYWCETSLESIKELIEEKILERIGDEQTWAMRVKKRRWQRYHTAEIVEYLAAAIDREVNLDNPDRILWVDVVGRDTAVSLLAPDDIFSTMLPDL